MLGGDPTTPVTWQHPVVSQPSFDFGDVRATAPTYTVVELADRLNNALALTFRAGVWVTGEITGLNERNGHYYFRLVANDAGRRATIDASLFAPARERLAPLFERHGFQLADGMQVRVFGRVDFYAPSGRIGVKVTDIDPRHTLGELAMRRDAVVARLVAAGLYDANRSRPLAPVPLRVGVVTSVDSAAWADFRHEIERSGIGFVLRLLDVRVQGERAVAEVSAAVARLGAAIDHLDVVALVRGGGSRTELATFDAEPIARAIAASSLPVFTGLGHETDRSVADEVAHTCTKTPTACAAALVERVQGFSAFAEEAWARISARAATRLDGAAHELARTSQSLRRQTVHAVDRSDERLSARSTRLAGAAARALERGERRLELAEAHARLLDPVHTLARGWSITRTLDGGVVRSVQQLAPGTGIVTSFADGSARSTVEETTP